MTTTGQVYEVRVPLDASSRFAPMTTVKVAYKIANTWMQAEVQVPTAEAGNYRVGTTVTLALT